MRPGRSLDLEVIQNHTESLLSRTLGVDGLDMVADGYFVAGIVCPSDTNLEC